jgi:pyrimidine operon attenuation protein / uracil phosphoribosyltransferase
MKTLLDQHQLHITLQRLSHQIVEQHPQGVALIGLQPRGVAFSDRIAAILRGMNAYPAFDYGRLDITFYRDDIHTSSGSLQVPTETDIAFSIEGRPVILIDDVLHTGRTIRAAMDALLDFGRPSQVQLMVLIDRRFSRELPVQPDYTGRVVDTVMSQKVKVNWQEGGGTDEVLLIG